MAAIGQTHVVLATYAGARFGFALLWMVVLAHVLTYPLFEYGTRYAAATGSSLVNAYLKIQRMRRPIAAFFTVLFFTLPFLALASLLSVTASILYAAFPQMSFNGWAIITVIITAALLFAGRYRWLEALSLAMAGVLVVGSAVAFGFAPPTAGDVARGALVPAIPVGSLVVLVALMRLPSDPASSILLSAWAARKREAWLAGGEPLMALRKSLLDLRLGYVFSLVVAVIFLCLGAVVLHPRGVSRASTWRCSSPASIRRPSGRGCFRSSSSSPSSPSGAVTTALPMAFPASSKTSGTETARGRPPVR
jgi:Mn2+/Fe2+ NRAMP family transporter